MKKIVTISALPILLLMLCTLPGDPSKNPSNASVTFTTVNGTDPVDLNEVTTGDTVILGYDLHLPDFIDSVQIAILSQKQ